MAEKRRNLTEERIAQIKAEKEAAEKAAAGIKAGLNEMAGEAASDAQTDYSYDDSKTTETKKEKPLKVMPKGRPFIAAGIVFLVFALIFPIYKMWGLVLTILASFLTGWFFSKKRAKQVAKIPEKPVERTFADEIAAKIYAVSKQVDERKKKIQKKEVRDTLRAVSQTMTKIADEVEKDPKDRNKVRKLANHYGPLIVELLDRYIQLEDKRDLVVEGENVTTTLDKLESTFIDADQGLKKILDGLFSDDAIAVSADVNVLESLMGLDTGETTVGIKPMDE